MADKLERPDPNWHATGALPRDADVRDWRMELLPRVAAAAAPPKLDKNITPQEWPHLYYQNGYSACVDHSHTGVKTAQDWRESGKREIPVYDAMEAYFANGGRPDGSNGIPTQLSLDRVRSLGSLDTQTKQRRKIDGYAFAPRHPDQFREAIGSALAANHLVVLATLLPQNYGRHSSGKPTSGYHQKIIANYDGLRDSDEINGPNSWGREWGELGFWGLTWGYILQDNFQTYNGYQHTYAYILFDAADYQPPPKPDPLPTPNPNPTPKPKPDPEPETPVITTPPLYKPDANKLLVSGSGFHANSVLVVNGTGVTTKLNKGQLVGVKVKLAAGQHDVVVINPNNKRSDTVKFRVDL